MPAPTRRPLPPGRSAPRPIVCTAVGSIVVGLPYALRAYGNVEVEVTHWGWVSMACGCLLLALAWLLRAGIVRFGAVTTAASAAATGAVALLQTLPALLWVLFHGQAITDGSPPGGFVGHWALALPHVALAALALTGLCRLVRGHAFHGNRGFAEVLGARSEDGGADGGVRHGGLSAKRACPSARIHLMPWHQSIPRHKEHHGFR